MPKQVINSSKIVRSFTTTTAHATKARGFVFVTGQVPNNPKQDPRAGREYEMGGIEEQITQVMDNIKAILEEAGTNFDNVVKRNVYLTHAGDFQTVYKVMERYFTSGVASTGVITGLVPTSARVEVDVIAAMPD
jgi:2-iminobutanoate/2-iminopropanoate deaminase